MTTPLTWGLQNSKLLALSRTLRRNVAALDLLAGKACHKADICKAWVGINPDGSRRLRRGKHHQVDCFGAKLEVRYAGVYEAHRRNTEFIMANRDNPEVIKRALMAGIDYHGLAVVRPHATGGDFFAQWYLDIWLDVIREYRGSGVEFFGYTKDYHAYQVLNQEPGAFWVYSMGGLDDPLVKPGDCTCTIVFKGQEDQFDGPIICGGEDNRSKSEDYFYIKAGKAFGLMEH